MYHKIRLSFFSTLEDCYTKYPISNSILGYRMTNSCMCCTTPVLNRSVSCNVQKFTQIPSAVLHCNKPDTLTADMNGLKSFRHSVYFPTVYISEFNKPLQQTYFIQNVLVYFPRLLIMTHICIVHIKQFSCLTKF